MGSVRGRSKATAALVRRKTQRVPKSGLADALFSKVQQRVLGLLFGNPNRSFYAAEIIRIVASGSGAVQRELERLHDAGLITSKRIGNQRHFQANAASPLFEELRILSLKTFGCADVLRGALEPVASQVQAAFVYGSIAKGEDTGASDIDVMVISDSIAYGDVLVLFDQASEWLGGRKVAPTIYSRRELHDRIQKGNSFIARVLSQPKIWLIGDEQALAA